MTPRCIFLLAFSSFAVQKIALDVVSDSFEYGAHTCQKQRGGGQLRAELYKDSRQKCEWRVDVCVRLGFTTCARCGP